MECIFIAYKFDVINIDIIFFKFSQILDSLTKDRTRIAFLVSFFFRMRVVSHTYTYLTLKKGRLYHILSLTYVRWLQMHKSPSSVCPTGPTNCSSQDHADSAVRSYVELFSINSSCRHHTGLSSGLEIWSRC